MQHYPSVIDGLHLAPFSRPILSKGAPGQTLPPVPTRARRILVLRDRAGWPASATKLLQTAGYEVSHCDGPEDAPGCTLVTQPDLILVPVAWGELCRQLRALDLRGTRAIVAYGSCDEDESHVAGAMENGADDCVSDPCRLRELRARVYAQLRHVRDRENLQWARDQRSSMRDLAQTDPLTGLGNRRALDAALTRAVETDDAITLVLIDLDHFKRINDTHGHPAGDSVLRHVARALQQAAPAGAIVARWGGEEFAIAVRGELTETPEALGERLRCAVKAVVLPDAGGSQPVTASVGLAHDGIERRCWSSADLIHAADKALYESKRTGRDRVTVATTAA